MTKTKSRILTALALTTALTAPVLIAPMFTAPSAVAAAPTTVSGVQDFSDLAAKVTPAVVNSDFVKASRSPPPTAPHSLS